MSKYAAHTKVQWNEVAKVGLPPADMRVHGAPERPRTFLCRGGWSLFTSRMHDDGSGFESETDDPVQAWAIVHGA